MSDHALFKDNLWWCAQSGAGDGSLKEGEDFEAQNIFIINFDFSFKPVKSSLWSLVSQNS